MKPVKIPVIWLDVTEKISQSYDWTLQEEYASHMTGQKKCVSYRKK
jgi:hypothetical protein